MPAKSTLRKLPADLKRELKRRIVEEDYQTLESLVQWLKDEGFLVSLSSIQRHKQKLVSLANSAELLGNLKEPGKMGLQELERENGFLSATIARMVERKEAIQREQIRRYQGGYIPAESGQADEHNLTPPKPAGSEEARP